MQEAQNPHHPFSSPVLAFDVGGTRIRAGLVVMMQEADLSSLRVIAQDECHSTGDVLRDMIRLGHQLQAGNAIAATGVSIRGIVDPTSGVLLDVNGPLAHLIGHSLAHPFIEEFACPVSVENDARMYALGELVAGAGREYQNILCLTLGTGVGCSVALNRRMLRGARGVSGILGGHITVQVDGPLCTCGNIGCLEALIGTFALRQAIQDALATGRPSSLRDGPGEPQHLFAEAANGDELAQEIVARFATHLGAGIVSLIHAYDPDVVIIGGGMIQASAQFLPQVQEYVDTHAWTMPRGRVRVLPAQLGDAAALVGITAFIQDNTLLW